MPENLKPYPAYKDSGVPWLGQVPEHWKLRSLGSITTSVSHHGRPDLALLSVVRERGVIPRSSMSDEENHNFIPDDLTGY
jgi:type I restriction enzyme S subunit